MVTALLVGLCLASWVGLLLVGWEIYGLPRRRRRCVIYLNAEGGTLRGVLWSRRGSWLILRGDVEHIAWQSTVVQPVPGEVLLDKARVDFLQVE